MLRFALCCEEISKTTKKLQKEQILATYLSGLTDEDLAIAAVFFTGYPFPLKDQRVTRVGFAAIRDALEDLDAGFAEKLGPALLRTGDLGTAIAEVFSTPATEPVMTLKDVRSYYEKLTTISNARERREVLREMLLRSTPLEIKYWIKVLGGGMRIGLQEGLVESSIAKAFQQPLAKVQYANMLLGDIGECAVFARYARLEDARMQLLHPIKPMLASVEEDPGKILAYMDGRGLAEDKYDGIRAQIHKENQTVKIFSRDLDDITRSFPDVVEKMIVIPHSFLMDGEIVPFQDGKILSFALLQNRLGRKVLSAEMLEQIPCRYFAFDLLFLEKDLLLDLPLIERRERLLGIQSRHAELFSVTEQRTIQTIDELEGSFDASR